MRKNILKYWFIVAISLIFILGFYLRISAYMIGRDFWHDECSLAINVLKLNYPDLFGSLLHLQSAPPLFLAGSKFLFLMSPYTPEKILRIIPLVASCLSIFVFYKLTKSVFQNKLGIIIANVLFAINYQLIYYAQEFKQYSSDVFVCLLLILMFDKMDIANLKKWKTIAVGLFFAVCPLISLPSAILILMYGVVLGCKRTNIFSLLSLGAPFAIVDGLYYFYTLKPNKDNMLAGLANYWDSGFLGLNPLKILPNLNMNLKFFCSENDIFLISLILLVLGCVLAFKHKNKIVKYSVLTVLSAYIFAFVNIYPLAERVALYLLPLFLIIMLYPLEFVNLNNKKSFVSVILALLFLAQFNVDYIHKIIDRRSYEREYSHRLFKVMMEKAESDYVFVYNDASDSEYEFYATLYSFKPEKFAKITLAYEGTDWYPQILDLLPKNKVLVFYYPYDFAKRPVLGHLKQWIAQNTEVLYEEQLAGSYLAIVKN